MATAPVTAAKPWLAAAGVLARHRRFHEKTGKKKPGCVHCFPDGNHMPPADPVIIPETQAQVDPYELQLWRNRVEEIAGTGCPTEVAAKIMKLPIVMFVGQVKSVFNETWPELQERMRLTSLIDMQVSAIDLARKGRPRLFESLDKNGLLPALVLARKDSDENQKHPVSRMTDEELTLRLQAVLDTRPRLDKMPSRPTLIVEEPKPGEGVVIGVRKSSQRDEWDAPDHEPAKTDLPSPESVKVSDDVVPDRDPAPITARPSTEIQNQANGPVIAHPKSGLIVMEDLVRAHETTGVVKQEMLRRLE